ncbi:MAG: hypothetical protein ACLTZM_14960 [Ruminococcus sp.]
MMNQKKTAYLGLFAAIAIIFGYVESLIPFLRNSGNEAGACKSGGAFCAGEVYVERSGAGFHCENFYYRFYVWKRLQYYV